MYKKVFNAGILGYITLFILSIVFYLERSGSSDSALQTFEIIRSCKLAIQNYRFGAAITEAGPLAGRMLGFPLNSILIIYSAIFIVYYFSCYLVSGKLIGNFKMAMMLLLSQTIFVSCTFYSMQSELPQGLAMMAVVFAFLNSEMAAKPRPLHMLCLFAAIITVAFFHPLILFPFLFCFVFFLITPGGVSDKRIYYLSGILFIAAVCIKSYAFANTYDKGASANALNSLLHIKDYWSLDSHARFVKLCIDDYYWIPICIAIIIAVYIWKRQWSKLGLFILFVAGFLSLIHISYVGSFITATYMENLYLPLGIMLALPMVYDVYPVITKYKAAFCLTVLITANGLIRIYNTHEVFTRRQNWQRDFIAKNRNGKLLISDKRVPMDTLIHTWATPYEFWILSTVSSDSTASIMITDSVSKFEQDAIWDNKALISPWASPGYSELPESYFKFRDTVNTYTILK